MSKYIVGKHTLESLSIGMYSDPFTIFREYIQNSTDSIDNAVIQGILTEGEGIIEVSLDPKKRLILIRDNGTGILAKNADKVLGDIGNSEKDYTENRGFRGIGRLGGLGYSEVLTFVTSYKGESTKTTIKWDCIRLKELLMPSNKEMEDVISVVEAVTSTYVEPEKPELHYFEVRLENVFQEFNELLDEEKVSVYLETVAPLDFDTQRFTYAKGIRDGLLKKGYNIPTYGIYFSNRGKSLFKPYATRFGTGHQEKTKRNDYIKDIEIVYEENSEGQTLYIGWLAITNFYGSVSDTRVQGIRLRKGNILIGNETTFRSFFPSEGAAANRTFMGEIHIIHPGLIPNAKRDDFERNAAYDELRTKLSIWAGIINRKYRREQSEINSAISKIEKNNAELSRIEEQLTSGEVTSQIKREQLLDDLEKLHKASQAHQKELEKMILKSKIDDDKRQKAVRFISNTKKREKEIVDLKNQIINVDFATKNDLPSSYSKEERIIYQRIIAVIDKFFAEDYQTANRLREAIKLELSVKKKK